MRVTLGVEAEVGLGVMTGVRVFVRRRMAVRWVESAMMARLNGVVTVG